MARGNGSTSKSKAVSRRKAPRSLTVAKRGVSTGRDFADLMSALMSDLIDGRVTPQVGNATVNAGSKLLKVVELQYKYGVKMPNGEKTLQLAMGVSGL